MSVRVVPLTRLAFGIGAAGIDIAQCCPAQAIRRAQVRQRLLDHQLGGAIRVDRLLRRAFRDRVSIGHAIDRRAAGIDHRACGKYPHRIDQGQGVAPLVAIIERRIAHRLAQIDNAREMDHGLRKMPRDHRLKAPGVADVAFFQRPPAHQFAVAAAEIAIRDGGETVLRQRLAAMAADIIGAPRVQNRAHSPAAPRNAGP